MTGELYELPPSEFTRARDERAKELRKSGDREAADAVKALRKPTVAAWALNQLSRRRSEELGRLLSAGERLRAAQEELLAGGDRSAFQKAAAEERELVAELTGEAMTLASESGERSGAGLEQKISETLHAAALDEETAEELREGRLTREREAIGGFGAMTAAPAGGTPAAAAPAPAAGGRKKPAAKEESAPASGGRRGKAGAGKREAAAKRDAAAAAKRDAAAAAKREQAAADAERRQQLAAARTDERHARRELDAAAKALESAATRAEAAEAHAADAVKRAKAAAERLKEAKRAQAAAKKAHTRAERALKSAEEGG